MKRGNEAGFSLIEVLVAITILAAVVLPTCSALVLGVQLNEKSDKLMHAQLAVSSAVETLMAEGISLGKDGENNPIYPEDYGKADNVDRFPDVVITVEPGVLYSEIPNVDPTATDTYYNVTFKSSDGLVSVTTMVGAAQGGAA